MGHAAPGSTPIDVLAEALEAWPEHLSCHYHFGSDHDSSVADRLAGAGIAVLTGLSRSSGNLERLARSFTSNCSRAGE